MVFCNCDLLEDAYEDCAMCHRYNICKDYFTQHPEEINCADDLKPYALKEISSDQLLGKKIGVLIRTPCSQTILQEPC